MKKFIISVFTLCGLFSLTSCQNWLDVNHDPNVLEEIPDVKILLPAAELNIANNLMGWDFGLAGGFWNEYWTQKYTASQFKALCEYKENPFNYAYQNMTAGALVDLETIKSISEENEDNGNYFVAEALSIFTWQILTYVWGDIPYSEALKGSEGIIAPHFDKGQDIYKDLIVRIDNLLKVDLSSAHIDSDFDFVFGGDLDLWKQFANSLKLKLMLRQSETPEYDNAKVLAFVKANEFLSESACISGTIWTNQEGKRHPFLEFERGGAGYFTTNVIACKNFIEYLENNDDPRLSKLFKVADEETGYRGAFFGDFDSKEASDGKTKDDKVKYSVVNLKDDLDLMLMSAWEVNFYIAEVYARANETDNAKDAYDKAVEASLRQHGISDLGIVEADGYAEWKGTTLNEMLEQIGLQKWVANANYQHIESFLERNRIKYPAIYDIDIKTDRTAAYADMKIPGHLTVSVNGRGKLNSLLPKSPIYPTSVLSRNENSPEQKPDLGVKVWWDQKNEIIIE